jgi:UDPglucose 6-dehydrogenase
MLGDNMSSYARAVSVVGLGKLGAPIAACFAHKGYRVIGIDSNPETVRLINEGRAPLYEPRLQQLIEANRNKLIATENYEEAIFESDITFIVLPTPSNKHGGFSLRHILLACERLGKVLRDKRYHLVVLTSTVLPGATENEVRPILEAHSQKRSGSGFGLCYSPEFVALGSVIHNLLNPDFILIGESDPEAGERLASFYRTICDNQAPIARMNAVNAEITKLAVNTFVTTKITFANMLARVCERMAGADADVVTAALGLDARIGGRYLKGAIGYGGPCFPRDNLAFSFLAQQLGAPANLVEATHHANREEVHRLASLVRSKKAQDGIVGILGLAYKPDTNVVEESQGLLLAQALGSAGIPVVAYDPAAMDNARHLLDGSLRFAESLEACVKESDVLVITTPWEAFRRLEPILLRRPGTPRVVIDCWRILDLETVESVVDYIALGVGAQFHEAKTFGH